MVNDHGTLLDSIKAILDLELAFGNRSTPRVVSNGTGLARRRDLILSTKSRVLADLGKGNQKGAVKEQKNQPSSPKAAQP
jgi:hypothetical protein